MNCGKKLQPGSATEQFQEVVRRGLNFDRGGSKSDMNRSTGTLVAKVNRFNPTMDRMKGATLIKKGEEHWLWDVEGDPNMIDPRLGGNAKRPREKSFDEHDGEEENRVVVSDPKTVHSTETIMADPQQATEATPVVNTIIRATRFVATRSSKRIRHSEPSRLGPLPMPIDSLDVGPSRNTRSTYVLRGQGGRRASTPLTTRKGSGPAARRRAKSLGPTGGGKAKDADDRDQVAEITAGIDGFSVFTKHQVDLEESPNGFMALGSAPQQVEHQGVNASDWAHPVGHQAKVGQWLEETGHAGPPASVNAPKSKAPSSVFGNL